MNILFFLFSAIFLSSCAHYKHETAYERGRIFAGAPAEAIEKLKAKSEKPGKDQLLYLLDLGIAYHTSGMYKEAIDAFLAAETIAEIKDVTSISEETGTLLVTDNVKNYKGEDFEKVLINIYLALDFFLLGQPEEALVECRKVNNLLYRFINEGKRPYNLNPLAAYLSGILYEINGRTNDAYIDYKATHEYAPQLAFVGQDLLALSKRLGFSNQTSDWHEKFPGTTSITHANPTGRKDVTDRNTGEIILLVEVGRAPEKVPHPSYESLPKFRDVPTSVVGAEVLVNDTPKATLETIFSVRDIAHLNLEHRINGMIAKKIAGGVAKAAVGYGIGQATNNSDLGVLAAMVLFAADQADLRSWLTLPAEFQIARIALPVGRHTIKLRYKTIHGGVAFEKAVKTVDITPRAHVLLNARVSE